MGAVICIWILILVTAVMLASKVQARRARKFREQHLPSAGELLRPGAAYDVILTSGTLLVGVRFLGLTGGTATAQSGLPGTLTDWLVFGRPDGRRLAIRPNTIRLYEEERVEAYDSPGRRSAGD